MSVETINNNTEQSVVDLFKKHSFADDSLRSTALDQFLSIGLPNKRVEDYKFTPFHTILEKSINGADLEISTLEKEQVKELFFEQEGHHLVFVDGNYMQNLSDISTDEGLKISSENDLSLLNKIASPKDSFTALNTAFVREFVSIHAFRNKIAKPVFIYHFVNGTGESFSNPRILINTEEGAKVECIEKTWVDGDSETFINQVVEISVAKNASVNYSKLQNHARNVIIHDGLKVKQDRDSRFYGNTFTFSGKQIRNNLDIQHVDENCETHMHGLYLLDGSAHVDNHTTVDHRVPNCYSNEVYKGIVDGKAHGVFNGKIFVRQDAQQTNAFQSNNNISLSDLATINTKPQLEIWADDVKCSHGCTVGQLDEEALFYLRARGLDQRAAKSMLLIAFAEDTFEYIPFEFFKDEIDQLIQSRLG